MGYRGTEGQAASELDLDPDEEFGPIRADPWSSGRVLQHLAGRVGGEFALAKMIKMLQW